MKRTLPLLFLILVACAPVALQDAPCDHPVRTSGVSVTCVIDGDTVRLADGTKVRLIGVDTPEKDEYGYRNATQSTIALINGTAVRLTKDVSETDKFGRLLRFVYAGDVFVNEELVRQGWARARDYPPDIANAPVFHAAQDAAKQDRAGLWSER
ncbi:MAG: thermonuclease family protein [Nanoarchaeota archaeon]